MTYNFDDVANALNRVQPHDWTKFLRARLDGHGPGAPLDGLNRGGYKLVYKETPSEYFKNEEERRKISDLTYSLGMIIGNEGKLTEVLWEGLAYQKGLTVGTQIIAVDGIAYNIDRLKAAIKAAQKTGASIELLVKNGDHYRMYAWTTTMDCGIRIWNAPVRLPSSKSWRHVSEFSPDVLILRVRFGF